VNPILELQGEMVERLKAVGLVGGRIYDKVPTNAAFPYVSFGNAFELDASVDCVDGEELSLRIDVWSRAGGSVEVLRVAGDVRNALDGQDLELEVNALVLLEHVRTDKMIDEDGITYHAILEFRAVVEMPA
jgi:hypothetical protein